MDELKKLLENAGVIEAGESSDQKWSPTEAKWSDIYSKHYDAMAAELEKEVNNMYAKKTIIIYHLDSNDMHRWKNIKISVSHVEWGDFSDGPVFHAEDGEIYTAHPDYPIKVVG